MAPTKDIYVDEDGELFITNNEVLAYMWYNASREERAKIKQDGEWKVFKPRKKNEILKLL